MRRFLFASAVFFSGLLAGRFWEGGAERASAEPKTPSVLQNGDTNGDGARDISDAVYILSWLFSDGHEPVPIEPVAKPRFIDNGDGTVTDTQTNLMWIRRVLDSNGDGAISYEDAISKEKAYEVVQTLDAGGYRDWNMPLTSELASLVAYPRAENFIPFDPIFEIPPGSLWIASTNAGDPCHGATFSMSQGGFVELNSWFAFLLAVRRP